MASFLNTDLGDLYSQWGERVAFNEGYQRQKIASARSAGAAAFVGGLDPDIARENYLQTRAFEMELVSPDGLEVGAVDDLGGVDDLGAVDEYDPVEDDFVPFDPAEEWEIAMDEEREMAMEEALRDVYLAEAAVFEENQLFSRNL